MTGRPEQAPDEPLRRSLFLDARILVAAIFLVGIQVLLPLSRLRSDRPIGFGWHMYAHGPDRVRFVVDGPGGPSDPIDDHELFARRRPELRPERWAPRFLCERVPGATAVYVLVEGRPPEIRPCGE